MSYAQAAAKGPKQSPEEARAPQPAQVETTEGPASDLIDVDSPHISQVHSDFKSQAQQTGTQAERMAKEAEDQARQTAAQAEQKGSETAQEGKKKASEFSEEAEQKTDELSKDASKNYEKAKKVASEDYDKSKKYASEKYREGKELASETADELNIKAREAKDDLSANRDNPVVIGNAIAWTIGGVALGVGAYNKHVKGELDWGVVGLAAGAVGVLAVGDYYLTQWLFKNKYPKK
ncbi:hypothetical protein G7Y79_00038g074700 [Physcia stellaris]|nr:hypothetical protein G7Y79_00038g074700 [Physcia stellaris]